MEKVKIMGTITFSGELDPDPSNAAEALRRAGFEVTMMPEKFRSRLTHPEESTHCLPLFLRITRAFNSGHQNRKMCQAKLVDGAAMCAAQSRSSLGPDRVNKRRYRPARGRSAASR
jgi:hypothetical protein